MAAKKRSAAEILKRVADRQKATVAPVATLGGLKGFWDREFGVYQVRVVRVAARRGTRLSFQLIPDTSGEPDPTRHAVDLDDGEVVWGDLPSTAQLWKRGSSKRVGYLLLTTEWLAAHPTAPRPAPPPPLPVAPGSEALDVPPAPVVTTLEVVVKVPGNKSL